MALDTEYRDYFIRNLHDALSGHTSNNVTEAVKSVLSSLSLFFFFWEEIPFSFGSELLSIIHPHSNHIFFLQIRQ